MPSIQGRTRGQLRQHVGYAIGGVYVSAATAQGSSDNNSLLDNTLVLGGADTQIGKWIRFTSGSNDTLTRRVTDSSISSNVTTLTFMPAVGTRTASESYELWDMAYSPDVVDDFLNQAIMSATGKVYDPIENPDLSSYPHVALHGDGKQARFDIPSGISMISKIEYRHKVSSTRIHAAAGTFDETTDGDFTQSLDTKDRKQGTQSLKLVIATGASAGDFVTDSITSKDLSGYDTVEMWAKSTVATSSGNLKLHLDNGTVAADGTDRESLDIPALSANTWTFVRMRLANPETDTAIISVGLEYDSDIGAVTVWVDDIVAVANDTAEWTTVDRRYWKIDKEARDLVFLRDGQCVIGDSLIKITGGDKPALMTSDSDSTEIPDEYIVAQSITTALLAASGGPATDPDAKRQLSAYWAQQAERSKRGFPMLVNVRSVD
jgi:hypothetical protein